MTIPAAISLVTLGVRDVAASTRFYAALGFRKSGASVDGEVSFFHTAGGLLAVWGASELAADAGVGAGVLGEPAGTGGVSLAINAESRAAVDGAMSVAERAGAKITRAATATEWGGYNGYFADPDGHLWEVAHNPFWPLRENGLPTLPE